MNWNPAYALLLLFSTAVTFLFGLLIGKRRTKEKAAAEAGRPIRQISKVWVGVSFAVNLAILFFYKYFDFTVDNLNVIRGWMGLAPVTPGFDVLLPVGISFYIFQALSYVVDVYRGDVRMETNFIKYAAFVSFFPQLVAGPIERSTNLLTQFDTPHKLEYDNVRDGLLRMVWGFFLKIVIADRAAILVNQVFNYCNYYEGPTVLIAAVLFAFQVYGDFAGYSNIAIGAAQVMGFKLMKNFERPYLAVSVSDFWRRWHISLSTWFRDYLYIPLGGNRKGTVRKYINQMIVMLVSGLWHGAAWNYVIWGGPFSCIRLTASRISSAPSSTSHSVWSSPSFSRLPSKKILVFQPRKRLDRRCMASPRLFARKKIHDRSISTNVVRTCPMRQLSVFVRAPVFCWIRRRKGFVMPPAT